MAVDREMRPRMWIATYQGFATGRVIQYEVGECTPGDKVLIADFGGPTRQSWRTLEVKNGRSSDWIGNFPSAESAYASLFPPRTRGARP